MKMSETRPSKYLKATDLDGKDVTLAMNYVEMMEMQGQDEKPVLFFADTKKGLVLNVTNSRTIEDAYGDESDTWEGKMVTLYPSKTEFSGRRVDCIRVKIPAPVALATEVEPVGEAVPANSVPF